LLDDLSARDVAALADAIRDLGRDTSIIAAGRDAAALALVGGEILTVSQGVISRC
jgi:hypothetical protein